MRTMDIVLAAVALIVLIGLLVVKKMIDDRNQREGIDDTKKSQKSDDPYDVE